jgi:CRP-like cAMP-binding protein
MQLEAVIKYLNAIYGETGISARQVYRLALLSAYIAFEPNQWLFKEGEAAKGFYLMLEGTVSSKTHSLEEPGNLVGFKAFLNKARLEKSWLSLSSVKALFIDKRGYNILKPFLDSTLNKPRAYDFKN